MFKRSMFIFVDEKIKYNNKQIKRIEDAGLTYVDKNGNSLPPRTRVATLGRCHYKVYDDDGSLGEQCFRRTTSGHDNFSC